MPWPVALLIYRLLLPWLFVAAFPGWVVKMLRRGGMRTRLGERAAFYRRDLTAEPDGAVHVHAVSVGEALLGLKLIGAWLEEDPQRRFVLATGTATGHAVATAAAIPGLRVTYAPLDFSSMVRRYLDRFRPRRIVLIEGEVWPRLMLECRKRGIPVSLVNARMSPRSAGRYRKFAATLRPYRCFPCLMPWPSRKRTMPRSGGNSASSPAASTTPAASSSIPQAARCPCGVPDFKPCSMRLEQGVRSSLRRAPMPVRRHGSHRPSATPRRTRCP
ncbi:MAG: hypothetical protein MUC40_10195 [Akkermansiaceae bacterium]|nr:hypothetical protein [Akkermansiaceae bacterium]